MSEYVIVVSIVKEDLNIINKGLKMLHLRGKNYKMGLPDYFVKIIFDQEREDISFLICQNPKYLGITIKCEYKDYYWPEPQQDVYISLLNFVEGFFMQTYEATDPIDEEEDEADIEPDLPPGDTIYLKLVLKSENQWDFWIFNKEEVDDGTVLRTEYHFPLLVQHENFPYDLSENNSVVQAILNGKSFSIFNQFLTHFSNETGFFAIDLCEYNNSLQDGMTFRAANSKTDEDGDHEDLDFILTLQCVKVAQNPNFRSILVYDAGDISRFFKFFKTKENDCQFDIFLNGILQIKLDSENVKISSIFTSK